MRKISKRILSTLLVVVMILAMLPTISFAATDYYTATPIDGVPAAGSEVVIYSESAGSVFGSEAVSGGVVGSAVTLSEETGELTIKTGAGAYKVEDAGNGTVYLLCGGKYLTSDSSEVLTFQNTAISGSKWILTAASGFDGCTIKNAEVKYGTRDIYIEYYNGFKAWTLSGDVTAIYVFKFCAIDAATVDPDNDGYVGTKPVAGALPADGASVVIYNPYAGGVIGMQDSNDTSPSMNLVSATLDGTNSIDVGNGGMIFKVSIDNEGYYTFESAGMYLCTGATGNDMYLSDVQNEYTLWKLAAATGGYTIQNKNSKYNGTYAQYIEFFNSAFKTYSYYTSTPEYYLFNFYNVEDTYHLGYVLNPKINIETKTGAYVGLDFTVRFTVDDLTEITSRTATYSLDGAAAKNATVNETDKEKTYTFTIPLAELVGKSSLKVDISATDEYNLTCTASKTYTVTDEPLIVSVSPEANEATGDETRPEISASIVNCGTNPTVKMTIDGSAVTPTVTADKISYKPTTAMTDGKHTVAVTITRADNKKVEKTWSFFIGEAGMVLYFGQLHSHTKEYSDGSGTLENAYEHAMTADDIDFLFVTDHSNYFDTTSTATTSSYYNLSSLTKTAAGISKWEEARATAASYTTDDFIAGYGYEMTWSGGPGHTNTFNTYGTVSRNNAALNNKTGYQGMYLYNDLMVNANLGLDVNGDPVAAGVKTKYIEDAPVVSQLNHPGTTFGTFDSFSGYTPTRDTVISLIEVGNGEGAVGGSSYWPSYQYYDMALSKGWHVAPTNNQDNHKGNWGDSNTCRTVVVTDDFSEGGLYTAMSERRVYSTEDQNLQIYYYLNDVLMGGTIQLDDDEELAEVHFECSLYDPDGEVLGKIEIIGENGMTLATYNASGSSYELDVTLKNTDAYYYIKITQADGDIAVTAPVWVGEATAVYSEIKTNTAMSAVGEKETITAKVVNADEKDYTVSKVEFSLTVGENTSVIKTIDCDDTVVAGESKEYSFEYVRTVVGRQSISVIFYGQYNGKDFKCSSSMSQKVYSAEDLLDIGIDYGHGNFYVSGGYSENMGNFISYCAEKGVRANYINAGELTYENIKNYAMVILTVPFDTGLMSPSAYTTAELAAIKQYADNGGNLIVTTKSDRNSPEGELNCAALTNSILEAVDAKVRAVDGIIVDNDLKSNEAYRIYFSSSDNTNHDHPFTIGAYTSSNAFGTVSSETNQTGFQLYNAAPIEILDGNEDDVTVLVKGYESTWGASYKANFTGSAYEPNYGTDVVTAEMGDVNIMTYEELAGGGWLVTAGCTFFSNYDIKDDQDYTNRFIVQNILDSLRDEEEVTTIADVHAKGKEKEEFTVEGIVTSNASGYDQDTAFFDCIYIQDETRGINLFPVAGNYSIGQKVRAHGGVTYYCGEIELNLSDDYGGSIKIISDEIKPINAPTVTATAAMSDANIGNLVKVQGIVTYIHKTEGVIDKIYVRDASGEACLYINGYISKEYTGLDNLKLGNIISGIGIGSRDVDETSATSAIFSRLRVRDRSEIVIIDPEVNVDLLFSDVSKSDWFYGAVKEAVGAELFTGVTRSTFEPNSSLTRAMAVTVLYRLAGSPKVSGKTDFTDVETARWYTDAVTWGTQVGIVKGYEDNTFRPNQYITRQEMATLLYRYAGEISGMDTTQRDDAKLNAFPDAGSVMNYAKDAMNWCVAVGLINGMSGKLAPTGNATRAQFATITTRYMTLEQA